MVSVGIAICTIESGKEVKCCDDAVKQVSVLHNFSYFGQIQC
jgi:hypothetical protein